jgi:EmrB/QacA subfamily drug resistance transporter
MAATTALLGRARPLNQKVVVGTVFVAAMFMNIMDATIVNVALPTIGRTFAVRPDSVDTVSIGYLVSLAVFIPASGWIGDRFGGRRMLLISIVVFTGASALCGTSTSLGELVAFRVLQGAGGGLMIPVGMALLYRTFPPAERVRASSIMTVPTAFAPALGPVIGGVFVNELSWRWVFYVNVPIGVASLAFGAAFLARDGGGPVGPFDHIGFLLSACGFGAFMYGLSEGPFDGWASAAVMGTLAIGAALLACAAVVEVRSAAPLIDLRTYSDRLFRSCAAVITTGMAAFFGMLFLAALFFQDALGMSALQAGLTIFPEALGVMLGAQVVTRLLYPLFGPRRLMVAGFAILTASLCLLVLVGSGTSLWVVRLILFLGGYGMSYVFVSAQAAGFATITPANTAKASTIFNAQRQLGGAIGVALVTSVVAAIGPFRRIAHSGATAAGSHAIASSTPASHAVANLGAYHAGFLAAAGVSLISMLASLTVSDDDARHTMVLRGRLARRRQASVEAQGQPVAAS